MILASLLLQAAEPAEPPMRDCLRAMSQQEMNRCAQREFLQAEDQLNHQWERAAAATKALDEERAAASDPRPGNFETLLEAQRAWLEYRDAHCASRGYWARGGTLEPLLVSTCKTKLTEERIQQLLFLVDQ